MHWLDYNCIINNSCGDDMYKIEKRKSIIYKILHYDDLEDLYEHEKLERERVEDNVIKRLINIEKRLENDRINERDTSKDENKRALRGRLKKIHNDKRTINRVRNESKQSNARGRKWITLKKN